MKNKYLLTLLLIIFVLGGTYFLGWKSATEKQKVQVNSQVILEKIKEQYFLVTKSLFLNTEVDLVIEEGDGWKAIFIGDKIKAEGVVRVDIGVDLKGLDESDIIIDENDKKITIFISKAEILDSSLFGDIEIQTKKGLWTNIKDIFDDNESREHNIATRSLIEEANKAALSNPDIFSEAQEESLELIKLIIKSIDPEYELELKVSE